MVLMLTWIFTSTPGTFSRLVFNVLFNLLCAVAPLALFTVRKEAALAAREEEHGQSYLWGREQDVPGTEVGVAVGKVGGISM